jgi:hypothetical protein
MQFQITEVDSNLDYSNLEYIAYKHSREENMKVMERMGSNGIMQSENMKSKRI